MYDDGPRKFDLSHGQFSLLMLVAGHRPVSVGQIATELVMDRTTVTAALKPLERRGLVRTAASADQRRRLLTLTPAGRSLLAKAAAAWQALQELVMFGVGFSGTTHLIAFDLIRRSRAGLE